MKKVKTVLITLLIAIGFFGAIMAFFGLKNIQKYQKAAEYIKSDKELRRASSFLLKKWKEGATEKEWKEVKNYCPELNIKSKVDSTYSRCNATFFNCFLKKSKYTLKEYSSGKFYDVISRQKSIERFIPHYAIRTSVKIGDEFFDIDLEDMCRDVYLPQKNYGYRKKDETNLRKRKFTWTWDNKNQSIFIDKFLVTNREVNEWIEVTNQNLDLSYPLERASVSLPKDKMKQYCQFKGKKLASAKVLEAATFYPTAGSDLPGGVLLRNDYPWTRRGRGTFLYKLSKEKELEIVEEHCTKAYTRDCFEVTPFVNHKTTSSTWAGIFQTMGGEFEALENRVEKNRNLRASSFYFEGKSKVHKIGMKLSWDGLANLDKNIKWYGEKPVGVSGRSLEIGFRCMKYVQN